MYLSASLSLVSASLSDSTLTFGPDFDVQVSRLHPWFPGLTTAGW